MNTDKHRYKNGRGKDRNYSRFLLLSVFICVHLWIILLSSCSTKPTDMRSLVPAETIVYLETNDLAAALQPIVDAKPFREVAKSKPDFSALKGVQLAVAVTGFETSEEKLTDEHSVGRVQPHFVAVAETHAWQFQTVRFAEQKLGAFVAEMYDSEPTLESSEKGGGRYLVWTAKDGRKAFAVVSRSLIYFGNDETAIDKCLAVQRGEADSLAKAGKVKPADPATLASGYVSTDGVAQIANIVGLKFATEAGEDSEVQSAIAAILPQLIRNSVTDISWTSTKSEQGIEDKYQVGMPSEVANVFSETMVADRTIVSLGSFSLIPNDAKSATLYNVQNPILAWKSIIAVIEKQLGKSAGKIVIELLKTQFESYGVYDVDSLLTHGGTPVTANLSVDGDQPVVIGYFPNMPEMQQFLSPDLRRFPTSPEFDHLRKNQDGDLAAFIDRFTVVTGDASAVERIFNSKPFDGEQGLYKRASSSFKDSSAIMTLGRDTTSTLPLIEMLAREGHGDTQAISTYFTETRFTKSGMERKTTSDFGLIGSIIAQLAQD